MAVTEVCGDHWLASYRQLLTGHGLSPQNTLNSALAQDAGQRPALFSLAQVLARPELLENQLLEDYPDACHPRMHKARVSVLHQSLALQVIAPGCYSCSGMESAPPEPRPNFPVPAGTR